MKHILIIVNLLFLASCSFLEKIRTQHDFQENTKNYFSHYQLDPKTYKKFSYTFYKNDLKQFEYYQSTYYFNSNNTELITVSTKNNFYKSIYYFFNNKDIESISSNISKKRYNYSFWKKQQDKTLGYFFYNQLEKLSLTNLIFKNMYDDVEVTIDTNNYSLYRASLYKYNFPEELDNSVNNYHYFLLKEQKDSLSVINLFKTSLFNEANDYPENIYGIITLEPIVMIKQH